ncbi:unnamed protein product [Arabidopsis halleri]
MLRSNQRRWIEAYTAVALPERLTVKFSKFYSFNLSIKLSVVATCNGDLKRRIQKFADSWCADYVCDDLRLS